MSQDLISPSPNNEKFLTVKEVQQTLRCSRFFVLDRRKAGEIKAVKAGRKVLISESSVNQYLEKNKEAHQ